jgi:hypothetical protein
MDYVMMVLPRNSRGKQDEKSVNRDVKRRKEHGTKRGIVP